MKILRSTRERVAVRVLTLSIVAALCAVFTPPASADSFSTSWNGCWVQFLKPRDLSIERSHVNGTGIVKMLNDGCTRSSGITVWVCLEYKYKYNDGEWGVWHRVQKSPGLEQYKFSCNSTTGAAKGDGAMSHGFIFGNEYHLTACSDFQRVRLRTAVYFYKSEDNQSSVRFSDQSELNVDIVC